MRVLTYLLRFTLLLSLMSLAPTGMLRAADVASSGFGEIAIPNPQKPANAEQCVEPVEVMRRDHMKFLDSHPVKSFVTKTRGIFAPNVTPTPASR
jgi:hypothetical protein